MQYKKRIRRAVLLPQSVAMSRDVMRCHAMRRARYAPAALCSAYNSTVFRAVEISRAGSASPRGRAFVSVRTCGVLVPLVRTTRQSSAALPISRRVAGLARLPRAAYHALSIGTRLYEIPGAHNRHVPFIVQFCRLLPHKTAAASFIARSCGFACHARDIGTCRRSKGYFVHIILNYVVLTTEFVW